MRDLKKEAEWERGRYKRYQYRCPKDLADQFDEKLVQDGLNFSEWLKLKILGYIKEDSQ